MHSQHPVLPVQNNDYARLPMGLHCMVQILSCTTLQMLKPLTSQSCLFWMAHCLTSIVVPSTIRTHDAILSILGQQHASKLECSSTLLYDLYCCVYTVNWSFIVNILHYSFAKWPRSWREEIIASCWSGWHKTPLRPSSLCVNFDDELMAIT